MSEYTPGVYVKGDVERTANRASDAVALVFDGFKPKPVEVEAPVAVESDAEPTPVDPERPTPRPAAPKKSEDDK